MIVTLSSSLKKNSWVYTGYTYEELNPHQRDAIDDADVLVDGPFIEELKDLNLYFRRKL